MPSYLETLEARFLQAWQAGLGAAGIVYPDTRRHKWALMFLFEAMPAARSQEQIAAWYFANGLGHYDRQLRHMAREGWPLATGNTRTTDMVLDTALTAHQVRLLSMEVPNAVRSHANRTGQLGAMTWHELVRYFEAHRGGCAVCGERRTHYDKGHLDRAKGMEIDNIVPMCTDCNNWAQAHDLDFELTSTSLKARPRLSHKARSTHP